MNHCLVLDIGKTNKKAFIFDEGYRVVHEQSVVLPETTDDDGDPCEDIAALQNWVLKTATALRDDPAFHIRAVNCTAYGASLVHLDADRKPAAPLYNYLKPFPADLLEWFLGQYGGAEKLSLETASPLLGNLNSGLQLLRLKHSKPQIFKRIHTSVHLPQWVAGLLSAVFLQPPTSNSPTSNSPASNVQQSNVQQSLYSEMTSIGCHTMLWDFRKNDYHDWVKAEGLVEKFPPILSERQNPHPSTGIGLHDSSAALIPYLTAVKEPFLLLSTGTWCISLNPFNHAPLTAPELEQDCLCYLTYEGRPVKAARYFGGYEHEQEVKKIAAEYGVSPDFYLDLNRLNDGSPTIDFQNAADAYVGFMRGLMDRQVASTRLALGGSPVRRIFVDGGFCHNRLYMNLLAERFPDMEVLAAEVPQATALGAALAVQGVWNGRGLADLASSGLPGI